MSEIKLKPNRDKSLRRHHPWVFSGAIAHGQSAVKLGDTVELLAADGTWLARGAYSPHSQISVRVWTFDSTQQIGPAFFKERLGKAIAARRPLVTDIESPACRLVHAEADGLPGLVVDRYGEFVVCQLLAAGVEAWRQEIVAQLAELVPCTGLYERSDVDVRAKEGLPSRHGRLHGSEPPELVEIQEGPLRFLVDLRHGHKTGFYLDQRENRQHLGAYAAGADVLNCFAYTGGFGIAALWHGARNVINVDTSGEALALAARHVALNGLDDGRVAQREADVFRLLREYRDAQRRFDLIVLDPPKFAASAGQVERASRGYKDINWLAFQLLRPGGVLLTFSCSGHIGEELFQKIVAGAALDAGCEAQIIKRLGQAADHPVALNFPEGSYLKGLVCRVV